VPANWASYELKTCAVTKPKN